MKRLLTIDEAAEYISVSKNTLYQWSSQRRIESVHIGRKLLFDKDYLDGLIERSRVKPTEEISL
ncbi:MAG: hypothetical protein CMH78_01580 [Nitrospinae bacterium]|jgi:excisionase family DNA binding protein|nr:hypothetical protein [Nitrospinota bacterium]|tara:strand:+ start:2327 stop:2518 length:192 start_codon:yes stop_codon:yes gene_type:complete